ncbi:uncharacterized protein TNCV_4945761 [Trichonephila clavipes]|nr:uncharacterized protein TNCV_4945761 [Trichonephila clavipes]
MTPELAPHLLTTTPHQQEDVSALDRFSVHRCPPWRVFSGTGLELVTKPATIRFLYHSAIVATKLGWIVTAKSYCHLYGVQGYGQRQAYISKSNLSQVLAICLPSLREGHNSIKLI